MLARIATLVLVLRVHGLLLVLLSVSAVVAQGGIISFTGDLRTDANFTSCGVNCTVSTDGEYAQWAAFAAGFNVPVASAMTAVTFSYGGGTNGNGAVIAKNGFEPYLSLFNSSGNFVASTLFGINCPSSANVNSDTGFCCDVELDGGVLTAGTYQIAISAFENMSLAENSGGSTLSDGFTGLGNLAAREDLHYAFDVVLSPAVVIPEPASGIFISVAALGICFLKTRKKELYEE